MKRDWFEDDNGNRSSFRLKSFLVTVTFLIVWAASSAWQGKCASVDYFFLMFILAFNGLGIWQRQSAEPPAPKEGG